jgi:hypothetical protein
MQGALAGQCTPFASDLSNSTTLWPRGGGVSRVCMQTQLTILVWACTIVAVSCSCSKDMNYPELYSQYFLSKGIIMRNGFLLLLLHNMMTVAV